MRVDFLGVGSWLPEYEQADTASLLVNRHILVDTGWHVMRNLMRAGVAPRQVDTLLFTHMHQDHYMSLAALLFYRMNGLHDLSGLTVYGPEGLEECVDMALKYAGYERFFADLARPVVRRLSPGEALSLPDARISCIASRHAVPGLCYRFERADGAGGFTCSGDTAPFEALSDFVRGSDVLIHEASYGAGEAPAENACGHSGAPDAARAALRSGVKTLYMVHAPAASREASIEAARALFPDVRRPLEGDWFEV